MCKTYKCNFPAWDDHEYCKTCMKKYLKEHSNKRITKPNRKKKSSRNKQGTRVKLIPLPKLDDLVWKWCSIAFRLQDADEVGMCKCATCNSRLHYYGTGNMQLGHFVSRRIKATKFLRKNTAKQCASCNGPMGGGQQFLMGKYLNDTYGEGTAEHMIELSKTHVKLNREDYKKLLIDFMLLAYKESEAKHLHEWKEGMLKWQLEVFEFVINEDNPYNKKLTLGQYQLP